MRTFSRLSRGQAWFGDGLVSPASPQPPIQRVKAGLPTKGSVEEIHWIFKWLEGQNRRSRD